VKEKTMTRQPKQGRSRWEPIVIFAVSAAVALIGTRFPAAAVSYAQAQPVAPAAESPFRFEVKESTNSPRGPAVEGYVYNSLPWTITNVRLRVESLDASGATRGESLGWTFGHVEGHGRAYFFVPTTMRGATYRVTVVSFDKVLMHEPQAP
jgi:hypothetical protein